MFIFRLLQKYYNLILPFLLGLLALALPLLRDFHFESALLAASVGCFWAAMAACKKSDRSDFYRAQDILGKLYLFGLPLLVHTILKGCFSVDGAGFWVLLPWPAVYFGFSIGRLLRMWNIDSRKSIAVLVLGFITLGVPLIEFFNLPQVYFFNHVWGYWPGPIYDETIQITGSLLFYRFITLLWVLFLWYLPDFFRDKVSKWITIFSMAALILGYTYLTEGGINSPRSYLQQQLGAYQSTEHFDIYYDRNLYSKNEIKIIALEHEFYLQQINDILELDKPDQKIESYLYAHPWQKKKLVGAKFTSYVPVWLSRDQLHIAKPQIPGSLKHELVHVLAKQFGNKLFNASWSVGLVEGLATALDDGRSSVSTIDQIVASDKRMPSAKEMKWALSPLGFYGGRSAVNYTTSGSFVRYLIENYPVGNIKEAYPGGNFSSAYQKNFQELVEEWYRYLDTVKIDSVDRQIAQQLFSIPSIFEQQCPHVLSDFGKAWDNYRFNWADKDTAGALQNLEKALQLEPKNYLVKTEWVYQNLRFGNLAPVQLKANAEDTSAGLQLLYADAFALDGQFETASKFIHKAVSLLSTDNSEPPFENEALLTRRDLNQWKPYLKITYKDMRLSIEEFEKVLYRTKIRTLQSVLNREEWDLYKKYITILLQLPAEKNYMEQYIQSIHYLGYLGEYEIAEKWIQKLKQLQLRSRYLERLEQEQEWIMFLKNRSQAVYNY